MGCCKWGRVCGVLYVGEGVWNVPTKEMCRVCIQSTHGGMVQSARTHPSCTTHTHVYAQFLITYLFPCPPPPPHPPHTAPRYPPRRHLPHPHRPRTPPPERPPNSHGAGPPRPRFLDQHLHLSQPYRARQPTGGPAPVSGDLPRRSRPIGRRSSAGVYLCAALVDEHCVEHEGAHGDV